MAGGREPPTLFHRPPRGRDSGLPHDYAPPHEAKNPVPCCAIERRSLCRSPGRPGSPAGHDPRARRGRHRGARSERAGGDPRHRSHGYQRRSGPVRDPWYCSRRLYAAGRRTGLSTRASFERHRRVGKASDRQNRTPDATDPTGDDRGRALVLQRIGPGVSRQHPDPGCGGHASHAGGDRRRCPVGLSASGRGRDLSGPERPRGAGRRSIRESVHRGWRGSSEYQSLWFAGIHGWTALSHQH